MPKGPPEMPILCYHSVDPGWSSPLSVTPTRFERQMAWLAGHRRVVELDVAVRLIGPRANLPPGVCALTFDDGFDALHRHAWPVLARHRLPATMFLVAATLLPTPQPVDWVDPADRGGATLRTMTLDEVREMAAAGVRVGSHSYAHADLTALSEAECERDLRESRELLCDLLATRVELLSYPRGRHVEHVRRAARRAGYTYAFGRFYPGVPVGEFAIERAGIYGEDGWPVFRAKVSRGYLPFRASALSRHVQPAISSARRVLRRSGGAG